MTRHLGLLLYEVCPRFCPTTFHKASQYVHDISGFDFEMQDYAYMSGPTRYECDRGERKIFKNQILSSPLHEGDLFSPGDGLKSVPADNETRDRYVIAIRVSDSASRVL